MEDSQEVLRMREIWEEISGLMAPELLEGFGPGGHGHGKRTDRLARGNIQRCVADDEDEVAV
jgi:hypothetical protein